MLVYTSRTGAPAMQFKVHGQLPLKGMIVSVFLFFTCFPFFFQITAIMFALFWLLKWFRVSKHLFRLKNQMPKWLLWIASQYMVETGVFLWQQGNITLRVLMSTTVFYEHLCDQLKVKYVLKF